MYFLKMNDENITTIICQSEITFDVKTEFSFPFGDYELYRCIKSKKTLRNMKKYIYTTLVILF